MGKLKSVAALEATRERLVAGVDPGGRWSRVCLGPGCLAQGADKVSLAFKAAIKGKGLKAKVAPLIKTTKRLPRITQPGDPGESCPGGSFLRPGKAGGRP